MANLGRKNGIYNVRFRFGGKEFRKSLKTSDKSTAETALHSVEMTISRLLTGLLSIPEGVDPGDYIVSGGTLKEPVPIHNPKAFPSTAKLIREYLEKQTHLISESYLACQRIHLRHLSRHLGDLIDAPCDKIVHRDLDSFVQQRLSIRDPHTVNKERVTILQFYKWVVAEEYLATSPAARLAPIKFGKDLDPPRAGYSSVEYSPCRMT